MTPPASVDARKSPLSIAVPFSVDPVAAVLLIVRLEVGNLQRAHGLNGCCERVIGRPTAFRLRQLLARRSQGPEHLRPIESLPLAMLAETHRCRLFSVIIRPHQGVASERARVGPRPGRRTFSAAKQTFMVLLP